MIKALPKISADEVSKVLVEKHPELIEKMRLHLSSPYTKQTLSPLAERLLDNGFMIVLRKRFPDHTIQYTTGNMETSIIIIWRKKGLIS